MAQAATAACPTATEIWCKSLTTWPMPWRPLIVCCRPSSSPLHCALPQRQRKVRADLCSHSGIDDIECGDLIVVEHRFHSVAAAPEAEVVSDQLIRHPSNEFASGQAVGKARNIVTAAYQRSPAPAGVQDAYAAPEASQVNRPSDRPGRLRSRRSPPARDFPCAARLREESIAREEHGSSGLRLVCDIFHRHLLDVRVDPLRHALLFLQ